MMNNGKTLRMLIRLLGVLLVALVGSGVLTPKAAAAPAAVSGAPAAVSGAPAAVPADIFSDGWDWAKRKASEVGHAAGDAAKGVGNWLLDKGSSVAKTAKENLKSVASTVKGAVTAPMDAVNSAAKGWVQERLEEVSVWIAGQLGKAAGWLLATVLTLAFSLTSPDLDASYMFTWAGRVFALAVPITFTVALGQVIRDVLRGRGLTGVRWAVWGALVSAVASMVTLPILAVMGRAMDAVRDVFIGWVHTDSDQLAQRITDIWSSETWRAFAEEQPAAAAAASVQSVSFMLLVFCFFCFVTLLGGLGLVLVLLFREQLLAGAAVMTPVAYSGLASRPTRGWPRTILAWILALLVSPVAIIVILGLSISILLEADPAGDMSSLLQQMGLCITMLLSSMAMPAVAFKLFSFLGESAVSAMTDETGEAVESGAETVGSTVATVAAAAVAAGAAAGTGGASAGAGGGAASGSAAGGAGGSGGGSSPGPGPGGSGGGSSSGPGPGPGGSGGGDDDPGDGGGGGTSPGSGSWDTDALGGDDDVIDDDDWYSGWDEV